MGKESSSLLNLISDSFPNVQNLKVAIGISLILDGTLKKN